MARTFKPGEYAVILTRRDIDRYDHNGLFAAELTAAFASLVVPMRKYDYIKETRAVLDALSDEACLFFICFNGFGAELCRVDEKTPGKLVSAYSVFRKPLFDLMHDCPVHESMNHQVEAAFPERNLLITDYGYAALASGLKMPNVLHVPSITFPLAAGERKKTGERSIDVLLPASIGPPAWVDIRHSSSGGYRSKLYRLLFEEVSARAAEDLELDPISELLNAANEIGLTLQFSDADDRFLLTTTVDHVKLHRRERLLKAISHLPVTVMSEAAPDEKQKGSLKFIPGPISAVDLLALMNDSRCVICPNPHMTGYHERSLGAFTTGAAVISSPNRILEAQFAHRKDLFFYRDEAEVVRLLEELMRSPDLVEEVAAAGCRRARQLFDPRRLAETILSLFDLRYHDRNMRAESMQLVDGKNNE